MKLHRDRLRQRKNRKTEVPQTLTSQSDSDNDFRIHKEHDPDIIDWSDPESHDSTAGTFLLLLSHSPFLPRVAGIYYCVCIYADDVKVEGEEEDEEMRAMMAEFEKKKAERRAQLRAAQQQKDSESQGPPSKKIKSEADVQRIVSAFAT